MHLAFVEREQLPLKQLNRSYATMTIEWDGSEQTNILYKLLTISEDEFQVFIFIVLLKTRE